MKRTTTRIVAGLLTGSIALTFGAAGAAHAESTTAQGKLGFVWANQPTAASYTPIAGY